MAPEKKQSFLHGAALLAAATVIVKFLGALYKIPLGNIIDDAGFGYFNTAYDIYAMLLTISTTGLPVALSRMIAQSGSLGHHRSCSAPCTRRWACLWCWARLARF